MPIRSLAARVIIGLVYLAAYFALDYLSFVRPFHNLGITPWNPSPGLSLALGYLGGLFFAPFLLVAPALSEVVVRGGETSFAVALAASLSTGGSYLAAGLGLRLLPFNPRLDSLRDVLILIAIALAAATAAAVTYAVLLGFVGAVAWFELWDVVWHGLVGNLIGTLVTAPLVLLTVVQRQPLKLEPVNILQFLAILAALTIVFGYREATAFQLFYLLFLPLLWVALSHGTFGAVIALAVIQIGLVVGAEIRFGPDPGLNALQVLMIALAITGLIVGAIVSERAIAAVRLREQQAALSRAFRLRSAGEIAATIAHEINQPLTALSAYSGIAVDATEKKNWELAASTIRKVKSECDRANSVLRSIRDVLSQGALSKTEVDISALLSQLSDVVRDDLEKKNVYLQIDVAPGIAPVLADAIQLQQAVHNLIVNGAEAIVGSGVGNRIEIAARLGTGNTLVIEVRDNGPGFPPGVDTGAPAPFVTTKPEGSGLGLIVARSIAEGHGGGFAIQSNDQGTAVQLTLPVVKDKHGADSFID